MRSQAQQHLYLDADLQVQVDIAPRQYNKTIIAQYSFLIIINYVTKNWWKMEWK